jgi:hypothetical protein
MVGVPYGCWLNRQSQGTDGGSPRVELLLKGTYGIRTPAEPAATWIKDQATLDALYQKLNTRQSGAVMETPQIDFTKFGVLFLEMGQKPTGGYAINFDASKTQIDRDKLLVHVSWNIPVDGMTVTQAVTSPFIFLKLNYANITSILVLDQNNKSRFEVPIE